MSLKDDLDKLKLIDSLFHAFTLTEMRELVGADLVVSKLRGVDVNHIGPIEEIYETMIRLRDDNTTLKADLAGMKTDIQDIIRVISLPPSPTIVPYSQHLINLKNKHGIY